MSRISEIDTGFVGPFVGQQPIDIRYVPYIAGWHGRYEHMTYPMTPAIGFENVKAYQEEADRMARYFVEQPGAPA